MDLLARHRLALLGLDPESIEPLTVAERVRAVYEQFVRMIPYETLSRIARRRGNPANPDAWPRGTDRLLRDAKADGLGGTCFSMAYALAELLRGVGANAHTVLGHHLRKEEPHAAVVVYDGDGPSLYDASYFLPDRIPVRPGAAVKDPLFTHAIEARRGPMMTVVQQDSAGRGDPLYSFVPVPAPPDAFRRAWVDMILAKGDRPARLVRRVGDEIRWFGEEQGQVEVIAPCGRRVVPLDDDPAPALHRMFGVSEDALRSHFAATTTR